MSPQLQKYADAYAESLAIVRTVVEPLSDEQFNWKPNEKVWSVGECLQHLNLVGAGYVPVLEKAASVGHPKASGPFTYGWLSRQFTEAVSPTNRRKLKAMGKMKPKSQRASRSTLNKQEVLAEFEHITNGFLRAVRQSDGLDLRSIKVSSPFLKILRLPLGAFLDALGQHAIRHVQQATRITQMERFPKWLASE